MPLRTPPPPPMELAEAPADSAPVLSAPEPGRRATTERQIEAQPGRRPTLEMPLRQPAAAPELEPRNQPTNRGPELSLGRQIYARGVKDAQMPVFGALATNSRRTLQRNPAEPPAPGAALPFGPSAITGQAQTTSGPTPVLPQARVQRLDNPNERTESTLTRPNGPALQELDALPLAPSEPAPENPLAPNAPPTRRWQPATPRINTPNLSQSLQQPLVGEGVVGQGQPEAPSTGGTWQRATPRMAPSNLSGRLPLAPVVTRPRSNGQSESPTTDDTRESDELDDLTSDEDDDTLETTDANSAGEQIDLNDLADQLLPYIKRLMAIERDRHDPV
jgi:hypothetical protein